MELTEAQLAIRNEGIKAFAEGGDSTASADVDVSTTTTTDDTTQNNSTDNVQQQSTDDTTNQTDGNDGNVSTDDYDFSALEVDEELIASNPQYAKAIENAKVGIIKEQQKLKAEYEAKLKEFTDKEGGLAEQEAALLDLLSSANGFDELPDDKKKAIEAIAEKLPPVKSLKEANVTLSDLVNKYEAYYIHNETVVYLQTKGYTRDEAITKMSANKGKMMTDLVGYLQKGLSIEDAMRVMGVTDARQKIKAPDVKGSVSTRKDLTTAEAIREAGIRELNALK